MLMRRGLSGAEARSAQLSEINFVYLPTPIHSQTIEVLIMTTHNSSFIVPAIQIVPVESAIPVSPVPSPSVWMRSGYSPTEIILAIAILITSLSTLIKALVPVMMQRQGGEGK